MAQPKKTLRTADAKQSNGSKLVTTLSEWLLSFVSMPTEYALVSALYAVHSYVYRRFDSVAYLSLTSAEPQSGKTTLMRALCELADHGSYSADPTKASLFAEIADATDRDQGVTIGWDECEKAARESDDRREIINSGYTRDGKVKRINRNAADGESRIEYMPTYCPKILSGLGSLAPTIKDRSIVLLMRHGKAARRAMITSIKTEALQLQNDIRATIAQVFPPNGALLTLHDVERLDGREAELWQPLWTTATYLQLTADQFALLRRATDSLIEMKHSDPDRRYTLVRKLEDKQAINKGESPYGVKALRALSEIIGSSSGIWTADLVKAMNSGEWKDYRSGKGINARSLSDLVATFGVTPKQIKIKGKNANGFRAADVKAALTKYTATSH